MWTFFAQQSSRAQELAEIAEVLSFHGEQIDWHTDWWRLLIIGFAGLLFLYLLIRLALYLFRLLGVILCLAFGALGAYIDILLFADRLAPHVPEEVRRFTPIAVGMMGFVLFFAIAALIMRMIRKPVQALPPPKK
jgi:hypothetical protein